MIWTILALGVTAAAFVVLGTWGLMSIVVSECLEDGLDDDSESGDSRLND